MKKSSVIIFIVGVFIISVFFEEPDYTEHTTITIPAQPWNSGLRGLTLL